MGFLFPLISVVRYKLLLQRDLWGGNSDSDRDSVSDTLVAQPGYSIYEDTIPTAPTIDSSSLSLGDYIANTRKKTPGSRRIVKGSSILLLLLVFLLLLLLLLPLFVIVVGGIIPSDDDCHTDETNDETTDETDDDTDTFFRSSLI